MQRIVSSKTAKANEVSVSSNIAEQPPTPDSRGVNRCELPERARDYSDAQHVSLRLTQSTAQCQCMRLNIYFAQPWGVRFVGKKAQ